LSDCLHFGQVFCKIVHLIWQKSDKFALFATDSGSFALAQSRDMGHLKGAFQASSPKLFSPAPSAGLFSCPAQNAGKDTPGFFPAWLSGPAPGPAYFGVIAFN
jgi:hypothetical protein